MKKEYIKPSMEATAIEAQVMIAASVYISNSTTDQDASMAGERRGGWGDLWGADK